VSETENTTTPDYHVDQHVIDNYEALVADKERNLTFAKVAKRADEAGDKNLAAWARARAKSKGSDITPAGATPADPDAAQRAAKKAGKETHQKAAAETPAVTPVVAVPGDQEPITPPTGVVDYNTLTIPELEKIAAERVPAVDLTGLSLKGDIVAALELADEA
jgi:hypothetical protein